MIETFGLTKKYKLKGDKKEVIALNNASLSVKEGEIFGLLGPNGAGKTTLISILTTLVSPTSGYAIIDGDNILKNPNKTKSKVALMLDSQMLYFRITGYDNLKFSCKLYKVPNYQEKIKIMAKDFGLEKWLNQYVEKYSKGMKMKLALLRTLLLNRKILFLDEPTLGLDVETINFIVTKLKTLKSTIFLTSHDMNVVEKLCDRIAFIDKGKIIKIGTSEDIKRFEQTEILINIHIIKDKDNLISELREREFINEISPSNHDSINISLNSRKYFKELFSILSKYDVLGIKELSPTLGDLFLKIIH
ncbi:MAG: ABC transporter ATP-binding protein [Promethearchaeota archaeon]